jgi:hypothetical protein
MKGIKIVIVGILVAVCCSCYSDGKYRASLEPGEKKPCFFIGGSRNTPVYFAPHTSVVMADKSLKEIQDIATGDKVMGYDLRMGRSRSVEVLKCISTLCENNFLLNGSVGVNSKQPFYTVKAYPFRLRSIPEEAKALLGDSDGDINTLEEIEIKSRERVTGCEAYYDLKLRDAYTYFVADERGNYYLVKTCALPSIDCIYGAWH